MISKSVFCVSLLIVLSGSSTAFATNGMNLEGYGAKSHSLGGTSMAFDTGNSAVMNNPATLGMMKEGEEELGVGIRGLHPDVAVDYNGNEVKSAGTAYYMPSVSYMRKDGKFAWGLAVLAQGGMGTEYGKNSALFHYGMPMSRYGMPVDMSKVVPLSGEDIRSEVGIGRLMLPLAYNLTENTTIGISFDLLWGSMDLQMDMDGAHFAGMGMAGKGGSVSGSMFNTLGSFISSGAITDINHVRYNFSNGSSFIGEAIGYGTGFKTGFTHKFSKMVTVGGSYHSRTWLSDLETSKAVLSFSGQGPAFGQANPVSVSGTMKVKNFGWPETWAAGFALYPAERWMIVGDLKYLDWAWAMSKFSTTFTADNSVTNGPFAGQTLDVDMTQNWEDQWVYSVGVEYKASERLALRAGASFSNNPVPDSYLNPLFPAVAENHYTGGFGYKLTDKSTVAAALVFVPKVSATNADGLLISHGQVNWSLNYSHSL
ncbi:MAG: aromatic hydrocarbon degradation protein [Chlorobiaceae bacterium]|nr:aromatic hydrocarbon degradation protein [Chlorobiaceae bacterium]NTV16369.1 aromatic hydrocarbon degradation protein [Chlorobiaceae bacterium]